MIRSRGRGNRRRTRTIVSRYSTLPKKLKDMLDRIEPSDPDGLPYFPCLVTLFDGGTIDRVYVEPELPYLRHWGVYPEDDEAKFSIAIDDVAILESSPTRLPARFATEIYKQGESGMGYQIFTVAFADGQKQAYGMGNAVDFIAYPPGKGPDDVVAVFPHEGRNDPDRIDASRKYYWCLYSEE